MSAPPAKTAVNTDREIEEAIQRAFDAAPTQLSSPAPSAKAQADTKTFKLNDDAYYILEAYLQVGISLPDTYARCEEVFPKDRLAVLIELDRDIYTVRRLRP